MRRQGNGLTRFWVVLLLIAAIVAIPSARLAPDFAAVFWAGALVFSAVACGLVIAAKRQKGELLRNASDR